MKFKNHIEVQAGIKDSGNSIGSEGQILSSTGGVDQKVEWINQSAITASSDFIYYEVKNETGSTILKGKGVRAVGTDGNSGHILVDEMVADGTIIPRYFLGVLETDIENGGFARAIAFGELDQFNTNGQNGETWTNGQVLWCDPDSPGDFTITEPLGPNVKIPAAFVLKASTQGKIQVRVQANEGVKDLYDTKIDSQVDGDILVWDNTTGVWFNDSTLNVDYTAGKVGIGTVTPQEKLHIYSTGAGAVRAEIESTQATDTILKYTNSNRSYATFLTQSGNFSIYDYNAASHRFYMLANGNVGINTTTPSSKLESVTTASGPIDYTNRAAILGVNDSTDTLYANSVGVAGQVRTSGGYAIYGDAYGAGGWAGYFDGKGYFSGNVGIGTTDLQAKLHVQDYTTGESHQAMFKGGAVTVGDYSYISLNNGYSTEYNKEVRLAAVSEQSNSNKTGFAILTSPDANGASGHERLRVTADGNVGIGTTSPSELLHISSLGPARLLIEADTDNVTETDNAQIILKQDGGAVIGNLGYKTDTNGIEITNQYAAADGILTFGTSGIERMRVTHTGNVGIGTTSPTALLTLESNSTSPYPGIDIKSTSTYPSGEIRFLDSSGSEVSTIESWSNPAISYLQLNHGYTAAFSSSLTLDDGFLYLRTAGSERMRITDTGNVGIGITNPQTKLHLGTVSSSGTTIEELRIETGTSGGYGGEAKLWLKNGQYGVSTIGLGPDDGTGNPKTYIKYEDFGNKFYITTNYSARIFIDSSGNVGVGTISPSYKLDVLGDGRFTNGGQGAVYLGSYGANISSNYSYIQTSSKLRVNGSVKVADDTEIPNINSVGSIRYRTSGNNSYVDMMMQTGASTYAWVNIVTNNW